MRDSRKVLAHRGVGRSRKERLRAKVGIGANLGETLPCETLFESAGSRAVLATIRGLAVDQTLRNGLRIFCPQVCGAAADTLECEP